MAFCNPCVRAADSSMMECVQPNSTSLKMLLRRRLFKKSTTLKSTRTPTIQKSKLHSQSSARFQRIKGSNVVQEVNPTTECSYRTDTTNNYDMTVFHDDLLDDTEIAMSRRRTKKIPRWAHKSQLQLAFINQIYFHGQDAEQIFGSVRLDLAQEMVQSIEIDNPETFQGYPAFLPSNFV